MVATILFGYRNHCFESGTTFTPTTEAAGNPAANLGKRHPQLFWRLTTLTGEPNVVIQPPAHRAVDLVAVLYATVTKTRNILPRANNLAHATWVGTGVSASSQGAFTGVSGPVPSWAITESGSAKHHIQASSVPLPGVLSQHYLRLTVYADKNATSRNMILRMGSPGAIETNGVQAKFDLSNGTVSSSSAYGSGWTIGAVAVTEPAANVYRCDLPAQTSGIASFDARIGMLDGSFAETYAADSPARSIRAGGALGQWNGTANPALISWVGSDGATAAFWKLGTSAVEVWRHFALSPGLVDYPRLLHTFYRLSTRANLNSITVALYDQNNADAQLDVSNIYVGPVWTPTRNIDEAGGESWDFDPETGGRILTLTIGWASKADAFAEAMPMALRAGVGVKSAAVADGGQEYRAGKQPILVIVDPDDTDHAQQRTIYGWLESVRERSKMYVSDMDGAGNAGVCYALEFTIKEVLP